jgi:hypothetical protein
MNTEMEALREAIEEAGRGLAQYEKARAARMAADDATQTMLRAQLGALRATYAALEEMDARMLGFPEITP